MNAFASMRRRFWKESFSRPASIDVTNSRLRWVSRLMSFSDRSVRFVGSLALVLVVAACEKSVTPPIAYCTAPRSIAIEVSALDSISQLSVADSARGVVQSGSYADSLHRFFDMLLGGTQLGSYQVTVARPGYREWIRADVRVTQEGPCGNVIPEHLTALLQRTP